MTAAAPARALGFDSVDSLRADLYFNLVVLEHDLQITSVMAHGNWADSRPGPHLASVTVTGDRVISGIVGK